MPIAAMIFKRPKFFLDLGGGEDRKPVQVAPVTPAQEQPAKGKKASAAPAAATPATREAPAGAAAGAVLTTAEAIAAELAAAQANRPAPSQTTFAPECLSPGGALPRRRRLAGANLAVFSEMAKGMRG